MAWSIKDIEHLQQAGKIQHFIVVGGRGHSKTYAGKIVSKAWKNALHPQKEWVAQALLQWANKRCLILWQEKRFHPDRKWRFDWAIMKGDQPWIAVEYEGLAFKKTGHTESHRYSDNTDKYNAAAAMGITVFRITYLNYGTIIKTLNDFEKFKNQQNEPSKKIQLQAPDGR